MRALRRSIVWLILAGFLSAQGAVWVAAVHAGAEDDAACAGIDGPVFVGPHHQGGPVFEETNNPNPIEHCALCHMERAVHGARFGKIENLIVGRQVVAGPAESLQIVSAPAHRAVSPRGPPQLSL